MDGSMDDAARVREYARWCCTEVGPAVARSLGDEDTAGLLAEVDPGVDGPTVRSVVYRLYRATLDTQLGRDRDDPEFARTVSVLQLLDKLRDIDAAARQALAQPDSAPYYLGRLGAQQYELGQLVLGQRPRLDEGLLTGSRVEQVCLLHNALATGRPMVWWRRFGEAVALVDEGPNFAEVVLSVLGTVGLARAREVARATMA